MSSVESHRARRASADSSHINRHGFGFNYRAPAGRLRLRKRKRPRVPSHYRIARDALRQTARVGYDDPPSRRGRAGEAVRTSRPIPQRPAVPPLISRSRPPGTAVADTCRLVRRDVTSRVFAPPARKLQAPDCTALSVAEVPPVSHRNRVALFRFGEFTVFLAAAFALARLCVNLR
jgi:hypothetical protein